MSILARVRLVRVGGPMLNCDLLGLFDGTVSRSVHWALVPGPLRFWKGLEQVDACDCSIVECVRQMGHTSQCPVLSWF